MDRFPREHIRISESQVKRLAEGAAFHALRREGSAYDLIALEAGCTAASWQLGGSLTRAMLTASGIVLFEGSRRAPPRMVSYAEWKREAVAWTKCRAIPFFRQFRLRKSWLHWRRRAVFRRRAKQRRSLAESSIFSSGAAVRWLAKAHAAIAAATGEVPLELDLLPRCIDLALPAQKGPLDALRARLQRLEETLQKATVDMCLHSYAGIFLEEEIDPRIVEVCLGATCSLPGADGEGPGGRRRRRSLLRAKAVQLRGRSGGGRRRSIAKAAQELAAPTKASRIVVSSALLSTLRRHSRTLLRLVKMLDHRVNGALEDLLLRTCETMAQCIHPAPRMPHAKLALSVLAPTGPSHGVAGRGEQSSGPGALPPLAFRVAGLAKGPAVLCPTDLATAPMDSTSWPLTAPAREATGQLASAPRLEPSCEALLSYARRCLSAVEAAIRSCKSRLRHNPAIAGHLLDGTSAADIPDALRKHIILATDRRTMRNVVEEGPADALGPLARRIIHGMSATGTARRKSVMDGRRRSATNSEPPPAGGVGAKEKRPKMDEIDALLRVTRLTMQDMPLPTAEYAIAPRDAARQAGLSPETNPDSDDASVSFASSSTSAGTRAMQADGLSSLSHDAPLMRVEAWPAAARPAAFLRAGAEVRAAVDACHDIASRVLDPFVDLFRDHDDALRLLAPLALHKIYDSKPFEGLRQRLHRLVERRNSLRKAFGVAGEHVLVAGRMAIDLSSSRHGILATAETALLVFTAYLKRLVPRSAVLAAEECLVARRVLLRQTTTPAQFLEQLELARRLACTDRGSRTDEGPSIFALRGRVFAVHALVVEENLASTMWDGNFWRSARHLDDRIAEVRGIAAAFLEDASLRGDALAREARQSEGLLRHDLNELESDVLQGWLHTFSTRAPAEALHACDALYSRCQALSGRVERLCGDCPRIEEYNSNELLVPSLSALQASMGDAQQRIRVLREVWATVLANDENGENVGECRSAAAAYRLHFTVEEDSVVHHLEALS